MFNSFIWDLCNALWRAMPLPKQVRRHCAAAVWLRAPLTAEAAGG